MFDDFCHKIFRFEKWKVILFHIDWSMYLIICFVSMINTSISSVECFWSTNNFPKKHRINSKIISSNRSRNKGRFFQIFCLFSWWFCWPKKEILFRRKIPFFFIESVYSAWTIEWIYFVFCTLLVFFEKNFFPCHFFLLMNSCDWNFFHLILFSFKS